MTENTDESDRLALSEAKTVPPNGTVERLQTPGEKFIERISLDNLNASQKRAEARRRQELQKERVAVLPTGITLNFELKEEDQKEPKIVRFDSGNAALLH